MRSFRAHLELACLSGLPLFLHERDAHEDFVKVLGEFEGRLPPTVVHCFTGSRKQAETYVKMGLFVGVTGTVCMPRRGAQVREALDAVPIDRLMVETDAPWMHPDSEHKPDGATEKKTDGRGGASAGSGPAASGGAGHSSGRGRGRGRGQNGGKGGRGKGKGARLTCLPQHVSKVVATVAEVKGIGLGEASSALANNAVEFFRLQPLDDLAKG